MNRHLIKSVQARQIISGRGIPAVEAEVTTYGGITARAVCTAGHSVGTHEVVFAYDGGEKWNGLGVIGAVENVNTIINKVLHDMDSRNQAEIDYAMLDIGKSKLGGNAIGAVSAAALKAGALSAEEPLYYHIGGQSAVMLPCASDGAIMGSDRYLPVKGGKPTYSFIAYDFKTFSEAADAIWEVSNKWNEYASRKYGLGAKIPSPGFPSGRFVVFPKGIVKSDVELWEMLNDIIVGCDYEGRVGLQADFAGDSYYNREKGIYQGLFDDKPRTRDELIDYICEIIPKYNFVVIEDPLYEDDFEGHAIITKRCGIQLVGDDLFATNAERVAKGIEISACNAVLLKVNQIGSITEALEMVDLAYKHNYGIMPCCSRGENLDICDYCVGINAASIRESCYGTSANRFIEIERELGSRARFAGKAGLKGRLNED